MRLVSCVGLLMVIPAIALLTRGSMPMVNKPGTARANPIDKTRSITHPQAENADSVQFSKVNHVLPAQNHADLRVSGVAKANSGPSSRK